jgi:hypothetical protein
LLIDGLDFRLPRSGIVGVNISGLASARGYEFAAKIKAPASWRHWLWERSPMRPETQNAISFLSRRNSIH